MSSVLRRALWCFRQLCAWVHMLYCKSLWLFSSFACVLWLTKYFHFQEYPSIAVVWKIRSGGWHSITESSDVKICFVVCGLRCVVDKLYVCMFFFKQNKKKSWKRKLQTLDSGFSGLWFLFGLFSEVTNSWRKILECLFRVKAFKAFNCICIVFKIIW